MTKSNEELEFEVLGYKVKFTPDPSNQVDPSKIVKSIATEAEGIFKKNPSLGNGQVAILVALKLASEKLSLEREYQTHIQELQSNAIQALNLIEEVSPSVTL